MSTSLSQDLPEPQPPGASHWGHTWIHCHRTGCGSVSGDAALRPTEDIRQKERRHKNKDCKEERRHFVLLATNPPPQTCQLTLTFPCFIRTLSKVAAPPFLPIPHSCYLGCFIIPVEGRLIIAKIENFTLDFWICKRHHREASHSLLRGVGGKETGEMVTFHDILLKA